ncbi:MAG TPA: DUF3566 domain-containing protein [Actinomycetota bacterium]|nr:DUF3566 domain-containing protein [Actinomycetota bacterium]
MSSREERDRGWHANPEAATASGGHLTPEAVPADPWADPLNAPLPSELERMGSVASRSRTDMFPPSEQTLREERDQRPPPASRTRRRRVPVRRVKRQLKHIDPLTVLKLSGFYWAVFMIVWLVLVAILYSIVEAAGFFNMLEEVNDGFALGWGKLDITLGLVEKWAFLIGITFALVTTLVNVFLAFLYNVAADLIGGLELTFVERDT